MTKDVLLAIKGIQFDATEAESNVQTITVAEYYEKNSSRYVIFEESAEGTDEKTKKHLESLGITLSSTIRIVSQSGGSTICMIKEGRLALDRNLATKILVA